MADQSSALLALGDPTRLAIVEHLIQRPLAVVDLAKELPVTRPAVSQHLRILKDAGLVVDPDALAALRGHLDRFWEKALAAYKTTAEQPDEKEN